MSSPRSYSYSPAHRALEIVSIIGFFVLLGALGLRVGIAWVAAGSMWPLAVALIGGYLAADIFSGLVHWGGDTVGHVTWPIVGPNFILHFRNHHVDPKGITRHDFVETNGNNSIASLPVLMLALWLTPAAAGAGSFAGAFIGFAMLFVFATNQFHKWSHEDHPPALVALLQRWHLILPPDHHAVHHAVPHDKYYCITVGWMNPILHKLHFFRFLERLVGRFRPDVLHFEERAAFVAAGGRLD